MSRTMLAPALLAVLAVLGCADATAAPGPGAPGTGGAAPRSATADDILGRWFPADGTAQGRAFAEFAADGGWTGSDGCNGQRGTWTLGPDGDGTFDGTAGMSTMIGCENVPIARWIADAGRAELHGGDLVLRDASGAQQARLVRELP
ncbi:META domain-containing protein [Pseudonocardia parietis]|uniref:Heat shock protein HslJ n=1 Tax=Pseudonocardia parietis TaxID=570936 RepID=A0ABS4W310_9PSEU|nr:META domain-containing protein [Pseudonocardia parietis]MBP2370588.1 heat shock protein HslJ [Pseudonocardia parietis]